MTTNLYFRDLSARGLFSIDTSSICVGTVIGDDGPESLPVMPELLESTGTTDVVATAPIKSASSTEKEQAGAQQRPPELRCLLFFLGLSLALSGCGGFFTDEDSDGGTSKHVLYVVNYNDGDTGAIKPFSIKSSGSLSSISDEISAGGSANSAVVTSDNTYLYVGNADGGISAYSIASSGALTELTNSPYATGTTPVSLTIESGGKYLYALDTTSSGVSVHKINSSTGELTSVQTVYFSSQASVSGPLYKILAAPHKKFLYVMLGADGSWVYKINSGGTLTYVTKVSSPNGHEAIDLAFDPQGTYAYQPDATNGVVAYSVNTDGGLTSLGSITTGEYPVAVAVDPSGKYVYAVNQVSNSVNAFVRNSDGTLTKLLSELGTGQMPTSITIEPGGQFVYVTNQNESPDLTILQIQSDGTLTSIGTADTGSDPIAAATTHY
jgi:6-phosphogluconolactonase (cycloisomerase 2 family)